MQLSEQENGRRESLKKLKAYGIEPFPAQLYPVKNFASELIANFSEDQHVCIAGRLMRRKIQGKASFGTLQDSSGKIQLYFNRDEICPNEDLSLIHI